MLSYERLIDVFPSDSIVNELSNKHRLDAEEVASIRGLIRKSLFVSIIGTENPGRVYLVKDGSCILSEVPFESGGRMRLELKGDARPMHDAVVRELRMHAKGGIAISGYGTVVLEGEDVVFVPYAEPDYGTVVLLRPGIKRTR